MINDQFERFWEWLINGVTRSDFSDLDEWLEDKFLKYLAEQKPPGWRLYIDDIYDRGYLPKEVYKEEFKT